MGRLSGQSIGALVLKDLQLEQAQQFFEHIQNHRNDYIDTIPFVGRTNDLEALRHFIQGNLQRQEKGFGEFYTLWDGQTMAGYFLVREIEVEARWAEIGYMLGKPWQGRGMAKRICSLLIEDLLVNQAMQKVVICCNDDNLASIGLARTLGFREEGRLRNHFVVNGKLRTMLCFGLLKAEWQPGSSKSNEGAGQGR